MISEDKLTDAEQKVLAAFRADGVGVVDVADAEIRGDFLRELFLGEYDKQADYRGTRIVGAIINDEFNMEFCETRFPVRFFNCHFEKSIKFQKLACPELDLRGCTLKKGLDALYAKVAGGVFMRPDSLDGKKIEEFHAEGGICFACSDIGGQLICAGKVFKNEGKFAFVAQGAKVANDLALSGEFNGETCLAGAEIGGQFNCTGGSFQNEGENAFIAQNIKVAGDVRLGDGFNAEGTVTLLGADVGGQLICTGGSFQNAKKKALIAKGIKVTGDVFLNADDSNSENIKKFEAVGMVSLAYADIKGQLACNGGSFRNKGKDALDAQGIKVAGDVLIQDGFKAEGKVSFLGADIGGQLSFRGGSFQNEGSEALVAQGIKVGSDLFLIVHVHHETKVAENFSANGWVLFDNATIGGNLMLYNCKLTHLSLAGANVLGEFRDDANIYKDQNGNDIVLNIDGFRYHRLDATKEHVKDRLAWVSMSIGDSSPPYGQLMKVYREMGHMNWARDVGFELEEKRHKSMGKLRKAQHWLSRITVGYGYKPLRFLWWFPFAIGIGLLLFSGALCPQKWTSASILMSTLGNGITEQSECERWRMLPSDVGALVSPDWRDSEVPPEVYPKFIPLFYAIEVALPVLALGQTSNWQPESLGLKWIQGIFIIIGAVALAIPASYRTGFLNPRWWD